MTHEGYESQFEVSCLLVKYLVDTGISRTSGEPQYPKAMARTLRNREWQKSSWSDVESRNNKLITLTSPRSPESKGSANCRVLYHHAFSFACGL